ncbi:carbohydrate ABC transporter permease [Vallitalea guaymasensis]|uniref:Carbohydrate ABC transporter permease n=1 Tax=Vallitalea guaymasensis TaxID=1185412 RepID=A0A8J8SEG6_9FIRM|nr:carbohydrate ABC transporter permease [Vallitalea guaymasensis]QUH31511.1 carbohydrate ABC transporter permease [Vallitalea guaymasensis]
MKSEKISRIVVFIIATIIAVLFLFPFYICIVTAFKTPMETAQAVLALPTKLHWENFTKALEITNFSRSFINSLITTTSSVVFIVVCSSMCGYIIARNINKFKYRLCETILLGAMMVPFQVIMIPVYKMLKLSNMMNTLPGLIILLVGTSIPYSTFLYIGFVKLVPRELEEAATIDGSGIYRTYWNIVFPLLKPITATVATLHVMWMWNEFNISLIVLQKEHVKTIPIQQFYFFGEYTTDLNLAFASACIAIIPILIFFIIAQKFLINGLMSGAVKG